MDYQFYNWNHLINRRDRMDMCEDVRTIISSGRFWHNSPKYQTNVNIFGENRPYWSKLKMSFIWSAFAFLGKEVQIKNVQSWSFMTSRKYPEDRENLWHHHHHDTSVQSVSGVYYVKVPVVKKQCGTEFAPNGLEDPSRLMLPPKEGEWVIYNSKEWHRPSELLSDKDRFIVAADLQF